MSYGFGFNTLATNVRTSTASSAFSSLTPAIIEFLSSSIFDNVCAAIVDICDQGFRFGNRRRYCGSLEQSSLFQCCIVEVPVPFQDLLESAQPFRLQQEQNVSELLMQTVPFLASEEDEKFLSESIELETTCVWVRKHRLNWMQIHCIGKECGVISLLWSIQVLSWSCHHHYKC